MGVQCSDASMALIGSATATWPLGALAQKAPVRIGFLATGAAESANSAAQIDEIKHGLRETGLMEGRDYVLDVQFASGDYQLFPEMARKLVQAGARLLLAQTIQSVRAAQNVSPPVPVVMLAINDPVGSGLVASLARPGGHTTGMATLNQDLTPKIIEFEREVVCISSTDRGGFPAHTSAGPCWFTGTNSLVLRTGARPAPK